MTAQRSQVASGVEVGTTGIPAVTTRKLTLTLTIDLLTMAALGTSAASVPWIDQNDGHACQYRLVFHERTQLKESPSMMPVSLLPSNRYPVADSLEVFKDDAASGAFSGSNELLTDAVVFVPFF